MSDPKPSEREAFTAFCRKANIPPHSLAGKYAWLAWQAARLAVPPAGEQAQPVAYLRSITHPDWLEVCERDSDGAFPVYAAPAPAPSAQPMTWQPIETAPKDRKVLLWGFFWNGRSKFSSPLIGLWSPHDNEWCVPGEFRFKVKPTHWKPLDEPPTE